MGSVFRKLWVAAALTCLAAMAAPHQALAQVPAFNGTMGPYLPLDPPLPLPALSIAGADGKPVDPAAWKGRVVVLNLWATWCAPCVREMPSLDRLQQAYPPERLLVVALSVDRGGAAQVQPFFEKTGVQALGLYTDKAMAAMSAFGTLRGLPTTFVIGPDGTIRGRMDGDAEWDSPAARAVLEQVGKAGKK